MIKRLLNKLLIAPIDQEQVSFQSYLRQIESGAFRDRVVFGVSESIRGLLKLDSVLQPGAVYVGGMGSGKSVAMRFTLLTRLYSNSDQDVYILFDQLKGMTDYTCLFPLKENVILALNSPAKIVPVVDMLYAECMARNEAFSAIGAKNIYDFESKMRQKIPNYRLARIFLCFEEFHAVINSEYMKFAYKSDQPGTTAEKFKTLMRISRSFGFSVSIASQRFTPEDCPSTIKPGLTQLMAFRVNNPGDAAALNLPGASEISANMRGRCLSEEGMMQFPYLDDETAVELIKRFYRPLEAKMLKYQVEDFHKALSSEGNDGMVLVKPYKDILSNIGEYNPLAVFTRFLEAFNFKVERQTISALGVTLVAEKDGVKAAVLTISERGGASEKMIAAFKDGAKILGCTNAIVLSSGSISGLITGKLSDMNVLTADGEDLARIAEVLDNRVKLEDSGDFDSLFAKLALAKSIVRAENKGAGSAESASDADDSAEEDEDLDDEDFDDDEMAEIKKIFQK